MGEHSTVTVYTTHQQTEQGITLRNVTALTVVGGLLTIECEVAEKGYSFSAHSRFEAGEWTYFSAAHLGSQREGCA